MKKLFLIFILCVLSLYGVLVCYADFQELPIDLMADLPLAQKFEPAESQKLLNAYHDQLEITLAEQRQSLNALNYIYFIGSSEGSFDAGSLYRSIHVANPPEAQIALVDHELFKGYYSMRTNTILKQYQSSEVFDYNAFIKRARGEFDNYIKNVIKDQNKKEQLLVLLQSKLSDKLVELPPSNRKVLYDEILSLRQPANLSKALDHTYQVFESRVRMQLLRQMVEENQQKLNRLVEQIRVSIVYKHRGQLLLQSNDAKNIEKSVEIINVMENEEGYRGLTLLHELYSKEHYKLVFKKTDESFYEIDLIKAIGAITTDEKGYLYLDLDQLFEGSHSEVATAKPIEVSAKARENQLKAMEQLYTGKSKAAQAIVKELSRYGMYLELKDKKITNNYTRSFELKQKQWKKDMESRLNAFGAGGMADFAAYIKQFELLNRSIEKNEKEKLLIAKFRNSDIQYKKTEAGVIWITDLLFKIRNMQ